MQDAISAPKVGGIVRLTRFILRGTFLIELLGALAMLPVFCRDYGWRGVWMAVFHSISAFCNAGFDILGTENNLYPSLTGYAGRSGDQYHDHAADRDRRHRLSDMGRYLRNTSWQFHRYRMQSKVILVTTRATDRSSGCRFSSLRTFPRFPLGERILASLFQSVTPRTAGFNTVDSTRDVRRIAGRDDPSDAHRRFSRFYGGRHENNDAGSLACQCCRNLPPAGERPDFSDAESIAAPSKPLRPF